MNCPWTNVEWYWQLNLKYKNLIDHVLYFYIYQFENLETIYNPRFPNLIKFKVSLLQEKATEIESIDFVGCYTTRLKDDIYAATNISVEISVRIQTFIPVKVSWFLKGI